MNKLLIHDFESLKTASSMMHDGEFSLADVTYDRGNKKFCLRVYLPNKEQATYRLIVWPFYRRYIPWTGWELVFSSVESCDVQVKNEKRTRSLHFEIASIRLDDKRNRILIFSHYVVTIELGIAAISGEILKSLNTSRKAPLTSLSVHLWSS